MKKENPTKMDPYIALKFHDFRFFVIVKILMTMALQFQSVIVGWHIYSITHDPLSLGLIGLVEIIPNFAVTLFAGHFADLYDRKKIVLSCFTVLFICSLGLYYTSQAVVLEKQIWFLYSIIAVSGLARGIVAPSLFSILTECVPKEHYVNSTSWHSTLWQVAFMLGAGGSGFLFSAISYKVYLVISILIVLCVMSFILISPKPHLIKNDKKAPIINSIKSGIDFVFSSQIFLGAISLDLFAVLFGGAVALLPIYANDILKVGPQGLGFLKAAPSLGSFLMAGLVVYWPPVKNTGKKLLWAVAGFGVCMIIFGISKNYYLSLFILAISGACDNISVVVRGTIMQSLVPADMKGKVYAVNSIFIGSSNEIGAFESGVAAKLLGVVPSVVFGGVMTLLVVAFTSMKAPKLVKLQFEE
ncbi:MAG: MFS transporter [Bacteriovorax sp.]|jgi:MFS family permease|nr:MFS transporter [Bacteriovorax sp.]